MEKVLVDIIGSCVSRVVFLNGETDKTGCADEAIKITNFFDKQNIACCMSPAPFDDAIIENITSAEQWDKSDQNLRNMKLTLNKKTMKLLMSSEAEYLFIDLYDFHTPMIGYNNTFFSTFKHEFFNLNIFKENPDDFKSLFYFLDLPEWLWYGYVDLFFQEISKKFTNDKIILFRFCACNLYISKNNEVKPIPDNYKKPWMSNAKYNDKLRLLEEYVIKRYNPHVIDISKYFIGDENLYTDLQGSHFDKNYYKDSFEHVKRILFNTSAQHGYKGDFISCQSVKDILHKNLSRDDFIKMFSGIENPFNTRSVLDSYCKQLSVAAVADNRFFLGEIYAELHNNHVSWNDVISEEEQINIILLANARIEPNEFSIKFIDQLRSRCTNKAKSERKSFLIGKQSSLNILIAGMKFHAGNARKGYDYGRWNHFDALNRFENVQTQFFDYATEAQQRGMAGMSEKLTQIIHKEKPDIFLFNPGNLQVYIFSESLRSITDLTETQTILWMNDSSQSFAFDAGLWAPCVDYIITTSHENVSKYQAAGFGHKIIKSQWAFNPLTYSVKMLQKTRDISFVGSAEGDRSAMIDKMRQSGLSVDTFGDGWHEDSFIPFYDMVRIFGQSKINLNLCDTETASLPQINRRLFEVVGCGGFLITTPMENLEDYYEPDKEVVVAYSLPELIDKTKYYLLHDHEREEIARRGYERTIAQHTWAKRLSDIFQQIGFAAISNTVQKNTPTYFPSIALPSLTTDKNESKDISVSISFGAYNQLHFTKQCVESILHYTEDPYELILFDNGSTDGTVNYFERVKSFHPQTRIVRNFENRNVEGNGNYLFSIAQGRYIVGVTNDTVVHEHWLTNFVKQIESATDIAIVGPRSNNISGPQMASVDYDTLEAYQEYAADWIRKHHGENFFLDRIVGAIVIMKKAALQRIGGFDPDLSSNGRDGGYGFSDDDFTLRLRLGGYKSLVANDVFIHHYGSMTTRQYRSDLFGAPQNINKEKYLQKLQQNERITIGAGGEMILNPYGPDEPIPVAENMVIRAPRIDIVEINDGIPLNTNPRTDLTALAEAYSGKIIFPGGYSIQTMLIACLTGKKCDFLVIVDQRLAPAVDKIRTLIETALNHPDVAVIVPVGNYAPSTHKSQTNKGVEIISYADLSICVLNLRIIRSFTQGLSHIKNDEELLWFIQRRIRGEGYFIAKVNDVVVDSNKQQPHHPYDDKVLPEQLIKEKKYAEAVAIYNEDLFLDTAFAEAHCQLACIARAQRHTEVAIKHAEQALKADPHHILSLVLLSRIFLEQGDFKNARAVVSQANFKQPGHPEVQKIVKMYEERFKEHPDAFQKDTGGELTFPTHRECVEGKVSLIIVTHNRLDHTKKCVNSIRKHTHQPHEIILVDNASTDNTVKWLKRQVKENKNYCLIENKENIGLTKGRNQGLHVAQGEYIVLLDNDVIVSQGWLDSMLRCLSGGSDIGIVGPMTNNGSGIQQVLDESYRSVDYLDKYVAKFMERYRHRRIPCRNLAGFCLLFKHTLVEKIGLLDETFESGHFENEDFCLRAALEGYRNYIAGDVFVHHFGSEKSGGNRLIIGKKWELGLGTSHGKKLAVLKAMELADDLYQKGKTDQAVETFINCIKLTPEAKEIYCELTRIFIESRKYEEAWEVVGTMPDAVKNDLKGLEYAGYAKEGLGLDDDAAAYADKMLSQDVNYPAALNLKGVLAYKTGEKEKAADYFQKAIDADPGYGEACTNLGVLYWSLDKKEEALARLHRGFILSPTLPDTNSLYYSVVASLGICGDAEADFQEAIHLYPHNKNLVFLYIDILIQLGKLNPAMLQIEDALVLFGLEEGFLNAALAVRDKIGPLQIKNMPRKGTLSLCLIVKNEEKNLAKCLKSVRDIVDEMIVVDTGSTDRTADIARAFGAKIFEFSWTGDFSAARNYSLAQATGDWILVLDADEVISSQDFAELQALTHKPSATPAAYLIMTRNYIDNFGIIGWTPNDGHYPEEAGGGWIASAKVRLFKRRNDIFFSNPVHELVEDSLHKAKIPISKSNIIVHHYGKLDTEREALKSEDYYLLGKMKYESDPTNVKYVYELAKQAQELKRYEEAMQLWVELLSRLMENPQSPGYKTIAAISYGEPIPEIHIQLASAYLMLDRFEEALETARKAMEETRVKLPAYVHVYAYCEIVAGSLDRASSALEDLLQTMPDYPPAESLMAVIYCLEEKEDKARELFQRLRLKGISISSPLKKISKKLSTYGKKDEAELILKAVSGI